MPKIDKIEALGTYWWFEFFEEIGDFEKVKNLVLKEIEIFEPTIIIGLGKTDINKKVDKQWLQDFNVNIISHPTNGNFSRMQSELTEILK